MLSTSGWCLERVVCSLRAAALRRTCPSALPVFFAQFFILNRMRSEVHRELQAVLAAMKVLLKGFGPERVCMVISDVARWMALHMRDQDDVKPIQMRRPTEYSE